MYPVQLCFLKGSMELHLFFPAFTSVLFLHVQVRRTLKIEYNYSFPVKEIGPNLTFTSLLENSKDDKIYDIFILFQKIGFYSHRRQFARM